MLKKIKSNWWNEKSKGFAVVFATFILAELIINPLSEFPLNDDWSYSKSILNWLNGKGFSIGDFPAMTLLTHLLWGALFAKVFGFSFIVLRISTLIMSLVGLGFLYALVIRISKNTRLAVVASLVMLFDPIYFNLSNTFMTDITFNTLLLVCCYFAYLYFQKNSVLHFFLVFVFSILLVLTRQLGIILPIAFFAAVIITKRRSVLTLSLGLSFVLLNLFILHYYENYLHNILPDFATYKFSGELNPFSASFWDTLLTNLRWRHSTILMHLLVYTLPLSIVFFGSLFHSHSTRVRLISLTLVGFFTFFVFYREPFPMGNVFVNVGVGTRTFYEYLCPQTSNLIEHASSQLYEDSMHWIKLAMVLTNALVITWGIIRWRQVKATLTGGDPAKLFFLLLLFAYSVMILIPGSYFDRYHIPVITLGLILCVYLNKIVHARMLWAVPLMIMFMYVSVAGTKDYFEINRKRWEAYHYLKDEKGIDHKKINGGFEVNCWNEGEFAVWYDFYGLDQFDYLIQFSPEKDFRPLKDFEFQRYFPYKKDKIFIFAREGKSL